MTVTVPLLTVIVPVYDGAATLNETLAALVASNLPRDKWELIVIDDASNDDSAIIAARYANRVIRLVGRPRGPAYARNRGFELARGDVIAFIDADVHINREALSAFLGHLARDSSIAAVIGSYDTGPKRSGVVTRYRNVLHHYLRLRCAGDVDVFWPACGAIRRSDFVAAGMFDEWHYWQPQAEGIELGHRLRRLQRRILLDPTIVATHVKHWSFRNVLALDLFRIGIPWMRLLFQDGTFNSSRAPSLLASEKISTALAAFGLLCGVRVPVFRLDRVAITRSSVPNGNLGFQCRLLGIRHSALRTGVAPGSAPLALAPLCRQRCRGRSGLDTSRDRRRAAAGPIG